MSAPQKVIRRANAGTTEAPWVRWTLIGIALLFMFLFLILPLAAVATEALRKGFGAYLEALKEPDNPFSLYSYLGRTNYGETPLLYGKTFDAKQKIGRAHV